MATKKSSTPQPQTWLYRPVSWLCRTLSRTLLGLQVTGAEQIPREGPLLVLASHQGMLDFMLVLAALRGRKLQFVATQRQFRDPRLHWFYQRLGVIPKVQFHTDPRCVMQMFRVLKGGGTVVLFPAGQTSMWGIPGNIAPAIVHFVKKAGVPVCTVGLRGGFFTASRFGGLHFGKTEARLELTFTPEQLKEKSEEELFRTVEQKLYYDEYAWQQETGVTFRGNNRAKGYEQVLFRCPKCGAGGVWQEDGNCVRCPKCGNTGVIGEDFRIRPAGDGDVVFETLPEWYRWQEELLAEHLAEPGFSISTHAVCLVFDEAEFEYVDAGVGTIRLDAQEIGYEGVINGKSVALHIRHEHLPGLVADPGKYIELFFEDYGLLRFLPEDKAAVTAIKLAQEYLYRKSQTNEQ